MAKFKSMVLSICSVVVLSACSSQYQLSDKLKVPSNVPTQWQELAESGIRSTKLTAVSASMLEQFKRPDLLVLVKQALENNFSLKQQYYTVEMKRQALTVAQSELWPTIDANLSARRNKSTDPSNYSTTVEAGIDISYELDLWQKLSDAEQEANLSYLASEATYEQAQQTLIATVTTAWLNTIEANLLVALSQKRVDVAKQSLDIIEVGYQQGLNEALDVYLARNDFNSEVSRLSQQKASLKAAKRSLERLVGDYPAGLLDVTSAIPTLTDVELALVPSELIENKPELKSSWYSLMADNAGLAFAHKQRFPSFKLSGSIGDDGEKLSDLFSGSGLAWSLLGSITAPLFNAGKLKANEKTAELTVKQSEQAYLELLYDTFEDVENLLTQTVSLSEQYKATVDAEYNAKMASELSFEQYQSGLVNYTTVLDAQTRWFDAQNSVIQLRKDLVENQVQLQLAIGGPLLVGGSTDSTLEE